MPARRPKIGVPQDSLPAKEGAPPTFANTRSAMIARRHERLHKEALRLVPTKVQLVWSCHTHTTVNSFPLSPAQEMSIHDRDLPKEAPDLNATVRRTAATVCRASAV